MLSVECIGTPYEIGEQHGAGAKDAVRRCIAFYTKQFKQTAKKDWQEVQSLAKEFEPIIRSKWPDYADEMRGVAAGAGVPFEDIIAINVRTEITFGLWSQAKHISDGCTALSWQSNGDSFCAQNWDWQEEQGPNLVYLTIRQNGKPTIKMVTEAGLIGKIGLNSAGVGVCLNAIRIPGLDKERIPVHLGLRMVLESTSRAEAVRKLKQFGVASACHMLVADGTGSIGLEWSSTEVQELQPSDGKILHTNHYCVEHPGIEDIKWLEDSDVRLDRIEQLSKAVESPTLDQLSAMLQDESSYPTSICRAQTGVSTFATLFSIVMDLVSRKAIVKVGQPIAPKEVFDIAFDS